MSMTAQLNPETLAARICTLIERRQFEAALRLIPAVAAMAPDQALASILAVRLAFAQGDHAKAALELGTAIATWPKNGELLRLRAQLAMLWMNFSDAAQAAAEAIILNSKDAESKSLLGRALLALGNATQASICLQEAVAANPHDVPAILGLAEASPEQANLLLATASARLPRNAALRTSLIRSLINSDEPEAAWEAAEAARDHGALDADGHILAGHAAALLDDWPQARRCWQEVSRLARHPSALYRLAAERARGPERLDPDMIAIANNDRADSFELAAMAGGTILPGRVRLALINAGITGPVLDLGCGTGLCAIAARDLGLAWDGLESSSRLATIARDRGLYRQLSEADPLSFLGEIVDQWPAIAFNFTAGLVRNLATLVSGLSNRLAPGGCAIGAIVIAPEAGRFGPFGCFEHAESEIRSSAIAAGLTIKVGDAETLLAIDGLAMQGCVVELRKP
jgi:predicted TPR repeat methyltransferase